jgi:hypothetical protein
MWYCTACVTVHTLVRVRVCGSRCVLAMFVFVCVFVCLRVSVCLCACVCVCVCVCVLFDSGCGLQPCSLALGGLQQLEI